MAAKPKSVRFDDLVKASGNPEQVTLWAKPAAGSDFMKAVDENRVATVVQHNTGTKKDFGFIGFETLANATFLLFPKPLVYAVGTKIVGIKYERIQDAPGQGPRHTPTVKPPPAARRQPRGAATKARSEQPPKVAPAPKPRPVHHFRATVELAAKQRIQLEVSAASMAEAARLLAEQADGVSLDPSKAELVRKVSKPKKVGGA